MAAYWQTTTWNCSAPAAGTVNVVVAPEAVTVLTCVQDASAVVTLPLPSRR
jgi:hypothetical protein